MEDKLLLIERIKTIRAQQNEVIERTKTIKEREQYLQEQSQSFQKLITDHANEEINFLGNERAYISQTAIQEEQAIQKDFQERLTAILHEKEQLQHRLEAEQEFISRNLCNRLLQLHQKTHRLRDEFSQKSQKINQSLLELNPEDAIKIKIQSLKSQVHDRDNKIAEANRQIEGLIAQNQRLKKMFNHSGQISQVVQNDQNKFRRSRNSFIEHVPSLTPTS